MYIYQDILDAKKALFCVIKGPFQFKRKISVIGLEEFNNLFPYFFPGIQIIIYSKTIIRYVQNLHNKIISLLFTIWPEYSIYIRRG